jgi:hypothetical protein
MEIQQHVRIGLTTALTSFVLGTLIFVIYFLTSAFELLFVGYAFIALTGIINIAILISIALKALKDTVNRRQLVTTCGIMLLNIPVMLSCHDFAGNNENNIYKRN